MNDTPFEKFTRDYRKLEVIFEENSFGNEMYIVHSGRVRLYTQAETGGKVTVAHIEEGGFFGEMTLIDGSPRSATAVAEEDTRLIALDRPKFLYMIQQQPMFAFTIMHALCDRIREANMLLAKAKGEEASR
jgi:CRP-like cAMP-binding protein